MSSPDVYIPARIVQRLALRHSGMLERLIHSIVDVDGTQQPRTRELAERELVDAPQIDAMSDAERAFIRSEDERECRRVVISQGVSVGTALLVTVLFEIIFVKHPPFIEHLVWSTPLQIFGAYFTSACLAYSERIRRYTIPFSLAMVSLVGALAGLVLGGLGGFDGPFFYSIYILPAFIMIIPTSLSSRALGTFAIMGGFLVLFIAQQPEIALPPYADITAVTMFIIASACVFLGHRNWIVARERAIAMYRLGQDRLQTQTQNGVLASKLRDQARRARALANEFDELKSNERVSIARDLHDDVGQILVGAKMELELLDRKLEDGERLGFEQLDRLYDVMHGLEDGIRGMIRRLRAAQAPDDLGAAIDELLEPYRQSKELEICVDDVLLTALDAQAGKVVYRVVQEGLTNAAKYSGATRWRVEIGSPRPGRVLVCVMDRGQGLNASGSEARGWGLLGLHERTHELGGSVELARRDGWTVLEAELPYGENR